MQWRVRLTGEGQRSLAHVPDKVRSAVMEFLSGSLSDDPLRVGAPLARELTGLHAARRGEYRVIYQVLEEDHEVIAHRIQHRRDAFRLR